MAQQIDTAASLLAEKPTVSQLVELIRVAETAERYEDMRRFMRKAVELKCASGDDLDVDERNLLSVAYKNVVGSLRATWRTLMGDSDPTTKKYRALIEAQLEAVCNEVINLLTTHLCPGVEGNGDETEVFYLKMCGDYYRYLCEVRPGNAKYENAGEKYYSRSYTIAQANLNETHPTRLGLVLNFSVFYTEILNDPEKACALAKGSFDAAIEKLDTLNDASYKDSTLIMQLMRDNLTLWSGDGDNDEDDTIGLSMGGAQDVNSYRQAIEEGLVPSQNALTYNGLLSEFYFDTKTRAFSRQIEDAEQKADDGSRLFYPSFCCAKSKSVLSAEGEAEYYLSVGLNSNLKRSEFSRKRLNLMIVADISGSMSDRMGYGAANAKTKMEVCNESVVALLSHLNADDRFAMVTFDHHATLLHEFQNFGAYDRDALQSSVLALKTAGGTDFECGFAAATNAFDALFASDEFKADDGEFDNRIIFLTDARPNHGRTDKNSLFSMVEAAANASSVRARIFSTFIGIGIDFNAALIEAISGTRGCNYFSVNSTSEFKTTMDAEFEHMVTPLVFNVSLRVVCEGNACHIDKVFGAPPKKERAILESGEVTRIDTLFPARKRPQSEGGAIKGGIQLIRLKAGDGSGEAQEGDDAKSERDVNVQIEVTFEDRNGKEFRNAQMVSFAPPQLSELDAGDMLEGGDGDDDGDEDSGFFDNDGIRKGVLLCRYAELMMRWVEDTPRGALKINAEHKAALSAFAPHFEREMKRCADDDLQRELDILQKLLQLDTTEYGS